MNGHFSPRQAEIVSLIAGGMEDKEIARQLGVSVTTVRTHLQRLYRQIGVHNRSRATVKWLEGNNTLDVSRTPSQATHTPVGNVSA